MRTLSRNSRLRRVGTAVAAAALVTALASCGGSDDGGPPPVSTAPSNTPPASASVDVLGFIAYLKTLVPTRQDTVEPLDISAVIAPTSDTTEPDPSI